MNETCDLAKLAYNKLFDIRRISWYHLSVSWQVRMIKQTHDAFSDRNHKFLIDTFVGNGN